MVLGILATNIRAGGGLTHLVEILNHISIEATNFKKIIVWAPQLTLDKIESKEFIEKRTHDWLNKTIVHRGLWIKFKLERQLSSCDLIFSPGGDFYSEKINYVTMSQNMLVYQKEERNRYGWSAMNLRLKLLNRIQSKSMKGAKGIIFISKFAEKYISNKLKLKDKPSCVIYHGIDKRFYREPQKHVSDELNLLYVSIIDVYKHQEKVAKAVNELRKEGEKVSIDFVGPAYAPSLSALEPFLDENIRYLGKVNYEIIEEIYAKSDAFIFASSCENMPNILVEAMASGKCILSSNMEPMPEILKNAGIYFNPLDVFDIKNAIEKIINKPEARFNLANKSFELSKQYSWNKSSSQTIQFLDKVACAE